jgi:hypothetical protein
MMAMLQAAAPELGFSFRSIGRFAKRAYNVAALPVRAMARVANATAASLCRDGKSVAGDSQSSSFCRAMKMKDSVNARKYLPAAVQRATQRAEAARRAYATAQQIRTASGLSGPSAEGVALLGDFRSANDMNLLADLHGADSADLAFALSGVDPNGLGDFTSGDALAMAPIAALVVTGLWMLKRR